MQADMAEKNQARTDLTRGARFFGETNWAWQTVMPE